MQGQNDSILGYLDDNTGKANNKILMNWFDITKGAFQILFAHFFRKEREGRVPTNPIFLIAKKIPLFLADIL